MIFLGMSKKPKTKEELEYDPVAAAMGVEGYRKDLQQHHWDEFIEKKKELAEEIKEVQGADIKDSMLSARREWYQFFKSTTGKIPDSLDKFYTKDDKADKDDDNDREEEKKQKGKKN